MSGAAVVRNEQQLKATQERIAYFQALLAQLRISATAEEFPSVASGYRGEVVKMQDEVMEYLTRHASVPIASE